LSLRLAMCPERISRPIAFIASALTAGRNDTKFLPCLFLASLAGTHTPGTQAVIRSDRPTKTARWRRPAGPTTATRVLDLLAIAKAAPPLPARRVPWQITGKGLPPGGHRNGCWSAEQVAPSIGSPRVTK
jgi:hypothetical protein